MARFNKFGNKKVVIEGIVFSSKKEAEHYLVLKDSLLKGEISDLLLQPTYHITKPFIISTNATKSGKSSIGALKYTPDFSYIKDGKKVVVEIKGKKTEAYQIRKKLFLSQLKEFAVDEFIEITNVSHSYFSKKIKEKNDKCNKNS